MIPNGSSPAFPFAADVAFQAGDIVFATDRFGCVVYWNAEAEAISGYKVEDVLGKPYTLACRMEADVVPLDLSAILAGRDFAGGVHCHSRSGGDVALYLFATTGRNPAGQPSGVVFVGRDVTGLWQAEEVAQTTADKYRVLFENNLDAVAIADADGKVLEGNPAYLRLYGYTVADVKGVDLFGMLAPEDRSAAAAARSNLAAGRPVTKTIRMRRKDGTRFVADFVASVMVVGGKQRIMSVTRDATGRARAEQAKSQSERMYRTVFESANDAVFIESVDGHILDVNRNGCELLGYRKDELLKRRVSDLVPPDARAWLPHVTDAILRDGTFRTEAVRVHKGGRHIPVDISASTMELDGRTVILSIVRDITARRLAEQALRESEEKFRSVSEQSPNMIFINNRGRVAYANQKSADVTGYTREEFYAPDFNFMQLIAPESAEQIKSVYARHARGEDVEPYEYTLVTKDGRRIEAIITTKLIEYDGTRAILGIVTDITERVKADRALREEKERSQTYLALAGAILVALDRTGQITLLNRRACQVLGVAESDALGRNWFDNYVPQRSREQVKATFVALMEGNLEPVEYYENPVMTVRGEERLGAWHNALLRDEAGRVVGTLSSGEDITERKAAERARLESERQYHTALDAMHDPIHVADADLRIVMVNQAFLHWLTGQGIDHSVLGKTVFDAFPFLPAEVREEYRCVFESGRPLVTEEETTIAGHTYVTETTKVPVTEGDKVVRVLTVVRDTTERRTAERALRESEENFRSLAAGIRDGVATIDTAGRFTFVNDVTVERSGRPREWWLGRIHTDTVPPEHRERLERVFAAVLRGEKVEPYEFSYVAADGRTVYVEANAAPIRKSGVIVGAVAINRDVTERKAAEKAQREREENFRALAENATDGVTIGDEQGRHVFVNRRAVEILGYPAEQLLRMTFRDFMPPGDRELLEERFVRRKRGEDVPSNYEITIIRRDGRAVPVEVGISQTKWQGRPSVMVMFHDISETKRSLQALAASEERYRNLVESSPDGIAVYQDGVVVLANRATAKLLGYDCAADLVGRQASSFVSPDDLLRVEERGKLLRSGATATGPLMVRFLNRKGDAVAAEVVGAITTWRGKPAVQIMVRPLSPRPG